MQPATSRSGLQKSLRSTSARSLGEQSPWQPQRLNASCMYWFRPILSELIGAAKESADVNRERAPSGPVKVVVTNRPHCRRNNGVDLVSGVSALLAWFPASWASKIAPCFIGEAPYKKLPLFAHIESLKVCKGMRLTKCCKQSSSPTRMSLD